MTQEQYMQLMAQQQMMQRGQQRQPSPQEAALMQQQMMAEQGPGAAGGFMGGLLDSALVGLLPNQSYLNPQDPSNAGAAKLGGLIGMILPILAAKYGIKSMLPGMVKAEGSLGKWLEAGAETQKAARLDMLASVLGGGIGGGLAEGPMGGLLGAAGMGAFSRFKGPGSLMEKGDEYAFSKMFGSNKVKPPQTAAEKAKQKQIEKNTEILTGDDALPVKEKLASIYAGDKPHFYGVIDDFRTGLDSHQFALTKVDGKPRYITPREIIKNAEINPDVEIVASRLKKNPEGGKPIALQEETKTWAQLEDDLMAPFSGKKIQYSYKTTVDGKTKTVNKTFDPAGWKKRTSEDAVKVSKTGIPVHLTELENHLINYHQMPMVPGAKVVDAPARYGENVFVKPSTSKASSGGSAPDVSKLSATSRAIYDALLKKGVDPKEALETASEMTDKNLMAKAFSK